MLALGHVCLLVRGSWPRLHPLQEKGSFLKDEWGLGSQRNRGTAGPWVVPSLYVHTPSVGAQYAHLVLPTLCRLEEGRLPKGKGVGR